MGDQRASSIPASLSASRSFGSGTRPVAMQRMSIELVWSRNVTRASRRLRARQEGAVGERVIASPAWMNRYRIKRTHFA